MRKIAARGAWPSVVFIAVFVAVVGCVAGVSGGVALLAVTVFAMILIGAIVAAAASLLRRAGGAPRGDGAVRPVALCAVPTMIVVAALVAIGVFATRGEMGIYGIFLLPFASLAGVFVAAAAAVVGATLGRPLAYAPRDPKSRDVAREAARLGLGLNALLLVCVGGRVHAAACLAFCVAWGYATALAAYAYRSRTETVAFADAHATYRPSRATRLASKICAGAAVVGVVVDVAVNGAAALGGSFSAADMPVAGVASRPIAPPR